MLLLLAEYLTRFDSAFGVFQYLTLRGILAAGTALAISLAIGPLMIRRLQLIRSGSRCAAMAHRAILVRRARRPWAAHYCC